MISHHLPQRNHGGSNTASPRPSNTNLSPKPSNRLPFQAERSPLKAPFPAPDAGPRRDSAHFHSMEPPLPPFTAARGYAQM